LADDAINRVAKKVVELAKSYEGDPALYFYGVANKIHLEQLKRQKSVVNISVVPDSDDFEEEYICLDRCMDRLPPDNRDLVMKYYDNEKNAKIAHRRLLAEQLGIGLNALRLRAHRIRLFLHECINCCLEGQTQR
jgi:DNA-directed RNA polymerase specialized sigma24 family protein